MLLRCFYLLSFSLSLYLSFSHLVHAHFLVNTFSFQRAPRRFINVFVGARGKKIVLCFRLAFFLFWIPFLALHCATVVNIDFISSLIFTLPFFKNCASFSQLLHLYWSLFSCFGFLLFFSPHPLWPNKSAYQDACGSSLCTCLEAFFL